MANYTNNSYSREKNIFEKKNISGNAFLNINKKHLDARSFKDYLEHRKDDLQNLGFDYRDQMLMRSLPAIFFKEYKRAAFLFKIEKILNYTVDHVKSLKKTFNYILPKHYRNFN